MGVTTRSKPAAGSPATDPRQAPQPPQTPVTTSQHPAYQVREFLDDQRRVLKALGGGSIGDPETYEAVDEGRLLPVNLSPLDRIPRESRQELTSLFHRKYGAPTGSARQERFFGVLRFVAKHAAEIEYNGFGRFDSSAEVHEELVRHLLNFPMPSASDVIPSSSLARFYDEWGKRWL